MATGSDDDHNRFEFSPFSGTLTTPSIQAPPLPTLPFDLLAEILCRLPVKLLLQLRCLCKSFNSLISDRKFAKKHLHFATKYHHHLMVSYSKNIDELVLFDSQIPSVFSTYSVMITQLSYPYFLKRSRTIYTCSCDGIFCFTTNIQDRAVLWNPSIRTFKILPHLSNTHRRGPLRPYYSFGYDHFIHNYKIIAISFLPGKNENEVSVHTLGTDSWRRIQDFLYSPLISCRPGLFVSGTANWLQYDASHNYCCAIVSLDLEKETYQKLSLPDLEKETYQNLSQRDLEDGLWILGVLKDCLCIFADNASAMILDVWVMKEYGNKNSWNKLYNISYMHDGSVYSPKILYINDDDQMLMDFLEFPTFESKLGLYDPKIGTLKIRENKNINRWMDTRWMDPQVYVESLISPCY